MSQWPKVPLGEVLHKSEDWIQLHPDRTYKEVTVRLWGKGATLRKEIAGAEIASATRLQVHANQFIISRIDARNGASGLIPEELEGAVVSNDFPVFTPNPKRLDPHYLGWLSKTKNFVELCKAASEGTTNRVRLKEEWFLATQIALPPLSEQRRLVERIDALAAKIHEATELRKRVVEQVNQMLICMAHRNDLSDEQKAKAGWSVSDLGDVITPRTDPVKVDTSANYPNLGIYSFGRGIFEKPPIDGMATSASTLFRVRARQFIYSRLFAFEGAYGIVPDELDGHYVSNEYPTFECKPGKLLPAFIESYFKAPHLWKDIAKGSKGLGDRRQRVHPDQVLAHRLWVPPLEWQHRIADTRQKLISSHSDKQHVEIAMNAMLPAILDRAFRGE